MKQDTAVEQTEMPGATTSPEERQAEALERIARHIEELTSLVKRWNSLGMPGPQHRGYSE